MDNSVKFAERLRKVVFGAAGIYTFYALLLLLTSPEQFPIMPYGIVFLVLFVLLVGYGRHLMRNLKNGKITGGLLFLYELNHYEFLIQQLVSRDFKTKYKRSVLGVLWSFLNPLMMMIVQYVVFSALMRFEVPHYAAYLLSGIILFSGFQDCSNQAMHSITGNASLIKKVYIPKYIYPASKVFSAAINTLLSMIPLLLVCMVNGVRPAFSWLLIPVGLVLFLMFTVGMGLLLSSIVVYFRDVEFLWGVFTSLWMYATPIIYPITIFTDRWTWMLYLEQINPMYHLITFMRTLILDGTSPAPAEYLICFGIGVAMIAFGSWVFRKLQDNFILYL